MSDTGKQAAAEAAARLVRDGMVLGLGSGSTADRFIEAVARRVRAEGLRITGVAPSRRSEEAAARFGIPLIEPTPARTVDLAVDGADEVGPDLSLIKGGGGALVREKIVAASAREFVVIADASKSVAMLGAFPLPVAVFAWGWQTTRARIEAAFGVTAALRGGEASPLVSDDGLYILDVRFGAITDPARTLDRLHGIAGVAQVGLFVGMASRVFFGGMDGGVEERGRVSAAPSSSA